MKYSILLFKLQNDFIATKSIVQLISLNRIRRQTKIRPKTMNLVIKWILMSLKLPIFNNH